MDLRDGEKIELKANEPLTDEGKLAETDVLESDDRTGERISRSAGKQGSDALPAGAVLLNRYELKAVIGTGGMATVYRAFDYVIQREVALKVLSPELAQKNKAVLRFLYEARTVGKLSSENIVGVHDCGSLEDGAPYIVMDLVQGESLESVLKTNGKLPPERAVSIISQVLSGILHAHAEGIVHRDLKPSNVILTRAADGTDAVKIVDFGIAKVVEDENPDAVKLTQTGEIFGSPLYMSPEQCKGEALDERADIYAVGCILYEMLSGTPPLVGENAVKTILAHISEEPVALATVGISPSLSRVVSKCLEKAPANRYESADQMLADLSLVMQGKGVEISSRRASPKKSISFELPRALSASVFLAAPAVLLLFIISGGFSGFKIFSPSSDRGAEINEISRQIVKQPQADLYMKRGHLFASDGNWEYAIKDFKKANEIAPGTLPNIWTCTLAMYKANRFQNASAYADYYAKCAGDDAVSRFLKGMTRMALGDYRAAADELNKAAADKWGDKKFKSRVYYLLSLCQIQLGQPAVALESSNKAVALNPDWSDSYVARAQASCLAGNFDDAVKFADDGLKREKEDVHQSSYLTAKAAALLLMGKAEESLAAAKEARMLISSSVGADIVEAEALNALGRTDQALAIYKEAGDREEPIASKFIAERETDMMKPLPRKGFLDAVFMRRMLKPVDWNLGGTSGSIRN